MLSSLNLSSLAVITDIQNAIFRASQKNQPMQIKIAEVQLTVNPNSNLSEVVALWETKFENREK